MCGKASKIHWIPNGVDVDATADVRPPVDGGEFVAMYAGAHGIPNGLDTLIQAAVIVQAAEQERGSGSDRPLRVVLIGDGKEKGSLKRLAHELGATNVSFRDPVAKSEIPALLRAADVLVLTLVSSPVFKDGISPNKLFDYMASARPVVMSVDTPLDPVRESGAGLTVPPGDPVALAGALMSLRDAPLAERTEMGLRGRRYIEQRHDLTRLAAQYADVLHCTCRAAN